MVLCHFDDVIIFGKNVEEHDSRLKQVLYKLLKAGWTLNADKCHFCKTLINLLRHSFKRWCFV